MIEQKSTTPTSKLTLNRRTFLAGTAFLGVSALSISGLTLGVSPIEAFGVTAAEKQAEADAALLQLEALRKQADVASADYFTYVEEEKNAKQKMDEAQATIDQKNQEISALQSQLGDRARSMYRDGAFTFLDLLFGATTFTAFASNWDLLNEINKDDATMVQQTKDLRAEVEQQKAEYANQEQIANQMASDANATYIQAEELISQTENIYNSLSAEAAQLLAQEEEAREAARLAKALAAEEQRRAAASANRGSSSSSSSSSGSGSSSSSPSNSSSSQASSNAPSVSTPAAPDSEEPQETPTVDEPQEEPVEEYVEEPEEEEDDAPAYSSSSGSSVVDRAYSQLGKPYEWGAVGPGSYDCSGFVSYCLTGDNDRVGTTYTFMGWPEVSDPQPGDICTNDHHCGVYVGGGMMVHAPYSGEVVSESAVHDDMIFVRPPW